MMRKNAIPPHVGIKGRINHTFPPLDEVNVRIDRELTAFKAHARGDGKRRVLLNNFNATVSIKSNILFKGSRPDIIQLGWQHKLGLRRSPGNFHKRRRSPHSPRGSSLSENCKFIYAEQATFVEIR